MRAKAYLQRTDGYAASAWNNDISASQKKLVADGISYYSTQNGIDTRNSKKVLIAEAEKTIVHNGNGYKTVAVSSSFPRVASSLTGGTLSGQVALDYIDMLAPTLNVTVIGATDTSVTLQVTSNATLSDMQYRVIGASGWVSVGAGSSKAFQITGLSPNTTYSFEIWGKKQSNGKEIYKTVSGKTRITPITAITLQNYTVAVGSTLTGTPQLTPANASIKTLRYTSSNPSVAELQSETGTTFTLIARNVGTAEITATATDGSGVSGMCTITVKQPVTGIQIANNQLVLQFKSTPRSRFPTIREASRRGVFKKRVLCTHRAICPEDFHKEFSNNTKCPEAWNEMFHTSGRFSVFLNVINICSY